MAEALDWLEPTARVTEDLQMVAAALGTAALGRAGLGQDEAAAALLTELDTYPDVRATANYVTSLPEIVRTALGIGDRELAERLVAGVEPPNAYAEHALASANADLTEARGDLQSAADAYADAANRWERFGVIAEQAFALLGQGRCLLSLSRPTEASPVLQHAREIFDRLQATPALAETDALFRGPPRPVRKAQSWSCAVVEATQFDGQMCRTPAVPGRGRLVQPPKDTQVAPLRNMGIGCRDRRG